MVSAIPSRRIRIQTRPSNRRIGCTTRQSSAPAQDDRGPVAEPLVRNQPSGSSDMRSDVIQPRQKYLKGRSPLRLAMNVDLTLALLHAAVHCPQTKPPSVPPPLPAKPRLP